MAKTTVEMVEQYKSCIESVLELKILGEEYWNTPLAEGKWTLKDVISHMMLWDKYFYEEAIEKIKLEEEITAKHLNFDEFNANAREYAKTQSIDSIVEQFIQYRNKIIDDISGLTEEEYNYSYKDGDRKKFTIRGYLRAFISHDNHHIK